MPERHSFQSRRAFSNGIVPKTGQNNHVYKSLHLSSMYSVHKRPTWAPHTHEIGPPVIFADLGDMAACLTLKRI
jgi:hypothetical protein